MTGPEHFREAERLLSDASFTDAYGNPVHRDGTLYMPGSHGVVVALAQVHATLALAAATAIGGPALGWSEAVNAARPAEVDAEVPDGGE